MKHKEVPDLGYIELPGIPLWLQIIMAILLAILLTAIIVQTYIRWG